MPRADLMMRQAISPRLAIRMRLNMRSNTPKRRHIGLCGVGTQLSMRPCIAFAGDEGQTAHQCCCERFRLWTWETIHCKISVSMSVSALRGAQDASDVVGASGIWRGGTGRRDSASARRANRFSNRSAAAAVIPERSMALTRALKLPFEPLARSGEAAGTLY